MNKLSLFPIFAVFLSACAPMESHVENGGRTEPAAFEDNRNMSDNLFGHGIINYHATKNEPRINYSFDTNMNPNDYRSMNQTRFDLSDDQDKIREAVKEATGLSPQMVTINGNYAHIHVNVPEGTKKKKRDALHQKIMDAVKQSVPRYKFSLKIDS
jgi:hypothetical protein